MTDRFQDKIYYSHSLKAGDTIGVLALSSSCEEQRFQAGVRYLESLGFKVRVALDPCRAYGTAEYLFSSDSAQRRAEALHVLFEDRQISAVLAARGACGSMEVLPLIDFEILRRNHKIFCGFSDTTAVLIAAYQKAGISVLHGPSLESAFSKAAQGDLAGIESARALVDFVTARSFAQLAGQRLDRISGGGECQGPLTGGNLCMLSHLMGTPWEAFFDGHLVFLEECSEQPYRIHRMLLQMKLAGKFTNVKGVLLGRFSACEHPRGVGPSLSDVFKDIFREFDFPVFGFADFGHNGVNFPVPYGVVARLSEAGVDLQAPVLGN